MLNKAMIIGRVGRDPETKYTQGGSAVCNISVATTDKWKDRAGEPQEKTEWHKIVAYGKLAEIIGEYVKKGSLIYIAGRIQTRSWEGTDGQKKYQTEIVAQEMKMLGGNRNAEGARVPPAADLGEEDVPF